tara:strand:+ start:959 stop:1210 length:252 start_codon:yes stop_codon:yes gene_type:complete
MSRFGDLLRGGAPAPKVEAAPAPEPVVEEVVEVSEEETYESDVSLYDMSKKELEEYGRTLGIELDRRRSKETLIEELKEAEGE